MSKFVIEVDTGNAAFKDNPYELADILVKVAREVKNNDGGLFGTYKSLYDTNGNKVGFAEEVDEEKEDKYDIVLPPL